MLLPFEQTNAITDAYLSRVNELPDRLSQEFVPDVNSTIETELDNQNFAELNKMDCNKVYDDVETWGVTLRTAGRPFSTFDSVVVNGRDFSGAEPCVIGQAAISPSLLNDHYQAGKTTNRIWITHKSGDADFPIVVVLTPDGFFNIGGAREPRLQGSAIRTGFIGEPFINEIVQHSDEVDIQPQEDGSLHILFNVHSEIGEGVALVVLTWDSETQSPLLDFSFSRIYRGEETQTAGFVGLNFMKGETLNGKRADGSEGPIEAFHDGLLGFVTMPDGQFERDWFTPPLTTTQVVTNAIEAVPVGSTLILDQLQVDGGYYSFFPDPSYGERADLIVVLETDSGENRRVSRYQKSVDLSSLNPEADETVNFFLEASYDAELIHESQFRILTDAKDFADLYAKRDHGLAFVTETEFGDRIDFLPLNEDGTKKSASMPLSGQVLVDIHNLDASLNGKFLLFDANDYKRGILNRIYQLNLTNGTIMRRTVDPFSQSSFDTAIGYGPDDNEFAMLTNRSGDLQLNIETVSTGLGSGFGNQAIIALAADWCTTTNEIFVRQGASLKSYDPVSQDVQTYEGAGQIFTNYLEVSPSCNQVLFRGAASWKIYSIDSDSIRDAPALIGAEPVWFDEQTLIDKGRLEANYFIDLIDWSSGEKTRIHTQSDPIGSISYVSEIDSPVPVPSTPVSASPTPLPVSPTATVTLSPTLSFTPSPTPFATIGIGTPEPPLTTPGPPAEKDVSIFLPTIFE